MTRYNNYADILSYIRSIKKDIKKGRHDCFVDSTHISILENPGYLPLEIAARFLRRKGYTVKVRSHIIPLSPLCFGRPLSAYRYVIVSY